MEFGAYLDGVFLILLWLLLDRSKDRQIGPRGTRLHQDHVGEVDSKGSGLERERFALEEGTDDSTLSIARQVSLTVLDHHRSRNLRFNPSYSPEKVPKQGG